MPLKSFDVGLIAKAAGVLERTEPSAVIWLTVTPSAAKALTAVMGKYVLILLTVIVAPLLVVNALTGTELFMVPSF
ncbi:hypothetical protein [Pantoea eucrina]|uniref:hypothetical protein n=1 Tax=Pantoea eucrina TaxID=472693 RepID=UPI000FE14921|nr:hypothetical protein [Pantoea eucrina]